MKSFTSLLDCSSEELNDMLHRADKLKDLWHKNEMPQSLKNKRVALWFYGQGFRNRIAFEIGARAMGADVSYIPGELGVNEPLEDIGPYLDNWFSLLVLRAKRHEDLLTLAGNASPPVINARTNFNHPCEIMGDLQFIKNYRGSIEGLNVAFFGEVTNLCMSWFEAAVRFPIRVTQIAPEGYRADAALLVKMRSGAAGEISISGDMSCIGTDTDLIYTDCWPKSEIPAEKDKIEKLFLPYQVTGEILARLNDRALFLPCPPVSRGREVSVDAMNSKRCLNFRAKEHLLHAQNAIMEFVLNG